jgi:PAS domain S-box-containing protein
MSDDSSLLRFAEALRARREELVDRIFDAYAALLPERYVDLTQEQLRQGLGVHVDTYLEAVLDLEARALLERSGHWFDVALQQGLPADTVLAMGTATRTILTDVVLAMHAEGVPGAPAGLRRLMDAAFSTVRLFDTIYRGHAEKAEAAARVYEALAEHAPDGIAIAGLDGKLIYANPAFRALIGDEQIIGRQLWDLVVPEELPRLHDEVTPTMREHGCWSGELRYRRGEEDSFIAHLTAFVMRDQEGQIVARCGIIRDLTQDKQAEEERRRLSEEIIRAQDEALRALSTPLVPLGDGVVAIPLVGAMDAARAERMQEVLLDGIGREGARVAILDVTGMKGVVAEVAHGLLLAARAARLLGAEVVISGIQPEVARTLVDIDADLSGVTTTGTLQSAVKHALRRAGKTRG